MKKPKQYKLKGCKSISKRRFKLSELTTGLGRRKAHNKEL